MESKIIYFFISLFSLCSSLKVLFHCNDEVELVDDFWPVFQLSPLEDPMKAKDCVHYFPFSFIDFVIFLRRTSKMDKEMVDSTKYPVFSSLLSLVTSKDFQSLFPKRDVSSLIASVKDEVCENFPNNSIEENKAIFEAYAEWWITVNYLYPFCYSSDFTTEDKEFSYGEYAYCFRVKQFKTSNGRFSIKLPYKPVFKSLFQIDFVVFDKFRHFRMVDLAELKWSLFFGLNKCPYIHLLNCLVIDSESLRAKGYLSEFAEYGSLESFIYKNKNINYSDLLNGLIDVAKGIQFIHDRKILHGDIHSENILVFPRVNSSNGFTLKLTDFGLSRPFDDHSPYEYDAEFNSFKEKVLKEYSSKEEQNSQLHPIIAKKDWNCFIKFLLHIVRLMKEYHGVTLGKIKMLAYLLAGKELNQKNILQTIQQYCEESIEIIKKSES